MPTVPVLNTTSAILNINLIQGIATNLAATTAFPGTSAATLAGFFTNLINSSGSLNATSANSFGPIGQNFVLGANAFISSSASLEVNQLLGATTAMNVLLQQNQLGIKIG